MLTSVVAGFVALALTVLVVSLFAAAALPWMIGAVLALALVGVVVLGAHAGGHGWFVPVPVLLLGAAWAISASAGSWTSPGVWALAALSFGAAVLAAGLVLPAIAFRHAGRAQQGPISLHGADGVALTDLSPTGIAKVNNETWTAQSLSGTLPAGSPVHVVRVDGVRLLVWSEVGDVPGAGTFSLPNIEKEAQ
jgi:membrane-bound ClpP family serine protease